MMSKPGGRWVLPQIPIWVCAAQLGRDFGTPDLERGIQFHIWDFLKFTKFLEWGFKNKIGLFLERDIILNANSF